MDCWNGSPGLRPSFGELVLCTESLVDWRLVQVRLYNFVTFLYTSGQYLLRQLGGSQEDGFWSLDQVQL